MLPPYCPTLQQNDRTGTDRALAHSRRRRLLGGFGLGLLAPAAGALLARPAGASQVGDVGELVRGSGLVVAANWEAKEGQADRVAGALRQFLPQAQAEPGIKLFLISRAVENQAQFLFYELFADEGALASHQASAHFETFIVGESFPLLAKRERVQYRLR